MSPRDTGHGSRRQHDGPSVGVFAQQRERGGDFDRSAWTHHDPAVRKLIQQAQAAVLREAAAALLVESDELDPPGSVWPERGFDDVLTAGGMRHSAAMLQDRADQIEETR